MGNGAFPSAATSPSVATSTGRIARCVPALPPRSAAGSYSTTPKQSTSGASSPVTRRGRARKGKFAFMASAESHAATRANPLAASRPGSVTTIPWTDLRSVAGERLGRLSGPEPRDFHGEEVAPLAANLVDRAAAPSPDQAMDDVVADARSRGEMVGPEGCRQDFPAIIVEVGGRRGG